MKNRIRTSSARGPKPAALRKGSAAFQLRKRKLPIAFERFSDMITTATGSTWAFITALALIAAWAVTGPLFQFSNAWQLGINTATTIVTFLMVFIIQQSQNKQGLAIQLKLNELIAADHAASNRLIDVEELTEDELNQLHTFYRHLIERTKKERPLTKSHSIEEIAHEQGLPKLKPQDTGT